MDQSRPAYLAGTVAIVGSPNTGKSTLLNALLEFKLAITSGKPHTSRHRLLGVRSGPGYQVAFLDTPGFMRRPKDLLDRHMLSRFQEALDEADLTILVVEPSHRKALEERLIQILRDSSQPTILVINKIDLMRKPSILPLIEKYAGYHFFQEIIPVSAKSIDGTDILLERIIAYLPRSPEIYALDTLTDRPERFLVEELVLEQLFRLYGQEIPYDTAVEVQDFPEGHAAQRKKDVIRAVIYVNKSSQKRILIGRNGTALKQVGIESRQQIEVMLGRPIFLELWVQVRNDWRRDEQFLREVGYSTVSA